MGCRDSFLLLLLVKESILRKEDGTIPKHHAAVLIRVSRNTTMTVLPHHGATKTNEKCRVEQKLLLLNRA